MARFTEMKRMSTDTWFTFVFKVPVAIGCTEKLWISSLYRFTWSLRISKV